MLSDKVNIVLSESLAKKLFGTPESCIEKIVEWKMFDLKKEAVVSGVYKDISNNSSEAFDFIMPFDSFKDMIGIQDGAINWDNSAPFLTYIVVREGTDISLFNNKVEKLLKQKSENAQHRTLFIKPYADNYLYGQYENGQEAGGRIEYVILFSIIAVSILLIACINFMNLSTAQALRKFREAGIKKIIGAQRKTLVLQYLTEAFVVTVLSFLLAVLTVNLVLPQFNKVTGKTLELATDVNTFIAFAVLITATTLIAGSYPALYLSGFHPGKVIKGQFNSTVSEFWARKGLVIFQFSLSVTSIVFVLIVYKQIEFIQSKNPGYNRENIIYFEVEGKVSQDPETIISEIKEMPGVSGVSSMLGNIVNKRDGGGMPGTVVWNDKRITMNNSAVNYGLIELLGMEMKEGRIFSKDLPSDVNKIIYNEAAIEALGIENPVGKIVDGREILGVVKNFHYQSLHEAIGPYCFRLEPHAASTIMVKIQAGTEQQTLQQLRGIYSSHNPGYVFNYTFLDTDYQEQYVAEKRVAALSQYATGLAILISCLGLFGLVLFTTERRGKEIGIRKVLGSSELSVVMLLSNDFMKLIIISAFVALPVSYFIAIHWLNNFAYKIELEWWYFISAALATFLVAGLTVSIQTLRAAKTNPVTMLRSE